MHLLIFASLIAIVSAHFQLQFPTPRGPFVEDNEISYCDGYNSTTSNRTEFPLTNGFFSLNSEHPSWTVAVLLANKSNPTSFADFEQITPFIQVGGEGLFCLPLGLASSNATGLQNGQNVTIQILYNGGDGNLYQCADLTLASNFTIASDITCSNATSSGSGLGGDGTRLTISGLVSLLIALSLVF